MSADEPVDCVTHLLPYIAAVFQLFSTGSWALHVLAREFHAYYLTMCDGLQWLGSPVVIVLLTLLRPYYYLGVSFHVIAELK